MYIAALDFFSYHAELLGVYLVDGSEKLYKDIKKLCSHKNNDISKSAYKALESLLKQVHCSLSVHRQFEIFFSISSFIDSQDVSWT